MQSRALIDYLKKLSPDTLEQYRQQTHELFERKIYSRLFNPLKIPIDKNELKKLKELFLNPSNKNLLVSISKKPSEEESDQYILKNESDNKRVMQFIDEMISICCFEILDGAGHLKWEIIELLNWKNFYKELYNTEIINQIVKSYLETKIGNLISEVVKDLMNDFPPELSYVSAAIFNLINSNYNLIDQQITLTQQTNRLEIFAADFVNALPEDYSEIEIIQLIQKDLFLLKEPFGDLSKKFAAFWVEVLFESLQKNRLHIFSALTKVLVDHISIDSLALPIREKYLLSVSEFNKKQAELDSLQSLSSNSPRNMTPILKILSLRDEEIFSDEILKVYIRSTFDRNESKIMYEFFYPQSAISFMIRLQDVHEKLNINSKSSELKRIIIKCLELLELKNFSQLADFSKSSFIGKIGAQQTTLPIKTNLPKSPKGPGNS